MLESNPGSTCPEIDQRSHEQARTDEQRERHRHLRHEQRRGKARARRARTAAGRRTLGIPGGAQGREHTDGDSGRRSRDERERDDGPVELGRKRQPDHALEQVSGQKTGRASEYRHDGVLGEYLAHQPATRGTERAPHGDLPLPRRRERQRQIREVGADDQQHDGDQRSQNGQRGPEHRQRIVGATRAGHDLQARYPLTQAVRDRLLPVLSGAACRAWPPPRPGRPARTQARGWPEPGLS